MAQSSLTNNAPSGYRSFAEIGDENHILIHVLPPDRENTSLWHQYMHDLDDFFIRLYKYHQKSGFLCLVCSQLLELVQIVYSVFIPVFFLNYVDYDILFKNKSIPPTPDNPTAKIHIYDVIKPFSTVTIPPIQMFLIFLAFVFLCWKTVKTIHSIIVNSAIQEFFKNVLHINDCSSLTWQDVQTRIINSKHNFLAQENNLTELDVHNRILRHTNYMIALVNRGVLPIYFKVPFLGESTFFTQSFLYNCQLLFFRGPFKCIFEENWLMFEAVKNSSHRQVVAKKLERNITILAMINLLLFPVLLIWQLLYFFYTNAALVKRDPVVLGLRNWSLYARWFCRHFNELEHQMNDRFNHAYKPARNYMDAFTSPLLEIIARTVRYVAGSNVAVLILLTFWDEVVIEVSHLITIMGFNFIVFSVACAFIPPDIPIRFTKVQLHEQILQHIHYVPHNYPPFTPQARSCMSELFQYKMVKLLQDLLSTVATPYIMLRHLRSRSLEIVDFFRNYTVEVLGTGDVCVFSMMNIKENGNPMWQHLISSNHKSVDGRSDAEEFKRTKRDKEPLNQNKMTESSSMHKSENVENRQEQVTVHRSYHDDQPQTSQDVTQVGRGPSFDQSTPLQTEHGKLEISLIHFKLQNPSWNPSSNSQREFIEQVTSQALEQAAIRTSNLSCTHDDDCGTHQQASSSNQGVFQRPRSPHTLIDIDSSTAVSLSTLFLHEHARLPMSTNFPSTSSSSQQQKSKSETDPLL